MRTLILHVKAMNYTGGSNQFAKKFIFTILKAYYFSSTLSSLESDVRIHRIMFSLDIIFEINTFFVYLLEFQMF